jgi:HK97 family phage portal protein
MANLLQKALIRALGINISGAGQKSFGSYDVTGAIADAFADENEPNYHKYQIASTQVTWIYSCNSLIAEAIAMVPWFILDDKNKEQTDGTLVNLLKKPNPDESWFDFVEGYSSDMEICGNSFWLLDQLTVKEPATPKYIYRLDPKRVQVAIDTKTKRKTGYVYRVNNITIPLDLNEIIHLKSYNPLSPFYGLGKVAVAMLTSETDLFASKVNNKFFKHGARLSGMLTTDNILTDETFKRVKDEFATKYQSANNFHKVALLEGGLKYQPMSLSPKDMDFKELRKFNRDEILSIFKVPPPKLGIMEFANYKMEEADKTFRNECLSPKLKKLELAITESLVKRFNPKWRFVFEDVAKDDITDKICKLQTAGNGATFSPNEIREYMGYPKSEWGDKPFVNMTIMPVGESWTESNQDNGGSNDANKSKNVEEKTVQIDIKKRREVVAKTNLVKDRIIAEFTKGMKDFFNKQEDRIIEKVTSTDRDKLSVEKVFNKSKEDNQAIKSAKPFVKKTVMTASERAELLVNKGKSVKALSADKVNSIVERRCKKITEINATTEDKIREVIKTGIEKDYHVNEIAYGNADDGYKGIVGVFDEASDYRAELIARTETVIAYSEASISSYKEMEVSKKEWITAGDGNVRETHQINEKQGAIDIDEAFSGTGEQYPGEFNCRCDVLPVITEGGN